MAEIRNLVSVWVLTLVGGLLLPLTSIVAVSDATYVLPITTTTTSGDVARQTCLAKAVFRYEGGKQNMASGSSPVCFDLSGSINAAETGGSRALVQMNSYLRTQGEGRMVAGYYISGNSGLVGSTYNVNVYALAALPGEAQGPFALVNALRAEASAAGASQISILGNSVANPMLLNMNPAVAGRLGFQFQQINPTTTLLQGAVR